MTLKNVLEARLQLAQVIRPTPLIFSDYFSELFNKRIYFKPENFQITGSFKVRGAYLRLAKLLEEQSVRRVICASAGNHAQGVAWAGRELGFEVKVVLPKYSPIVKIEAIRKLRAEIIIFGENFEEAHLEAERISREEDFILVHPYSDEVVIAGQGTIGLEILEELPEVGSVVVPVGGGGLIAGISLALKEEAADRNLGNIMVIGVRSKAKIAEGIFVKRTGAIPKIIIKKYADKMLFAGEDEISLAILMLMEKSKLVVEGAGAAGLAALLAGKIEKITEPVVIVLSGGNIDIGLVGKIIKRGLHGLGRMISIVVGLEDKPGELAKLTKLLAELGANIYQITHDRSLPKMLLTTSQVKIILETHNKEHSLKIVHELRLNGYQVKMV